jgi:hypothetical protein
MQEAGFRAPQVVCECVEFYFSQFEVRDILRGDSSHVNGRRLWIVSEKWKTSIQGGRVGGARKKKGAALQQAAGRRAAPLRRKIFGDG